MAPHSSTLRCWACGNRCVCTQLCRALCDPMAYSLLGSSVLGIFQARVLEWVAICDPIIGLCFTELKIANFFFLATLLPIPRLGIEPRTPVG